MIEYVRNLVNKYRRTGILVDTNILLLYVVGLCDPSRITKFKRTKSFTVEDFRIVANLINQFERRVTTPNILTETNSFLGQLGTRLKPDFFSHFASQISILDEHVLNSIDVAERHEFKRFGLTDTGIVRIVTQEELLGTYASVGKANSLIWRKSVFPSRRFM